MVTVPQARDIIFGVCNAAILLNGVPVLGYVPDVRWPGVINPEHPDNSKFWCRPSLQVVDSSQSAVAKGSNGKRKYTNTCLFFLQIFCPKGLADGVSKGLDFGKTIVSAFRSQDGEVWFRNQKVSEVPEQPDNYPVNVTVTCIFDTLE